MTNSVETNEQPATAKTEPVVVLAELERLFAATTQGEWRTLADSYTPAEWFVVVGPGIFGEAVIAGPSEAMTANPDFDWIAAMHNAFPSLVAAMKAVRGFSLEVIVECITAMADAAIVSDEYEATCANALEAVKNLAKAHKELRMKHGN